MRTNEPLHPNTDDAVDEHDGKETENHRVKGRREKTRGVRARRRDAVADHHTEEQDEEYDGIPAAFLSIFSNTLP